MGPDFPFHNRLVDALSLMPGVDLRKTSNGRPLPSATVIITPTPPAFTPEWFDDIADGAVLVVGPWAPGCGSADEPSNRVTRNPRAYTNKTIRWYASTEYADAGCDGEAFFKSCPHDYATPDARFIIKYAHTMPTIAVPLPVMRTGTPVVYVKAIEGQTSRQWVSNWDAVSTVMVEAGLLPKPVPPEQMESTLRALDADGAIRLFLADWSNPDWGFNVIDNVSALRTAPFMIAYTPRENFGSFLMEAASAGAPVFLMVGNAVCPIIMRRLADNLAAANATLPTMGMCVADMASVQAGDIGLRAAFGTFAAGRGAIQPREFATTVHSYCSTVWRYMQLMADSGLIQVDAGPEEEYSVGSCRWYINATVQD